MMVIMTRTNAGIWNPLQNAVVLLVAMSQPYGSTSTNMDTPRPCTAMHHINSGDKCHAFLTSALDRNKWTPSRRGRFILAERAPAAHRIRWVSPRASMEARAKKRKNLLLLGVELQSFSPQHSHYTD
jgi:hypothetical protein